MVAASIPILVCVAVIEAPNSMIFAIIGIFILIAFAFVIVFSVVLIISTRYLRKNQATGC